MIREQSMTPERLARINTLLTKRQANLTVMFEEVQNPFNVSAIVRTADSVGINKVHFVGHEKADLRKRTSMGSHAWVKSECHDSSEQAIASLKEQNMQVLVTHLDSSAVDFREIDYTLPTAIILGQEKYGVTDEAIALADHSIVIPMVGMVQSLNVSVAAALVLYEAQRQRQNAGMYNTRSLSDAQCQQILFEGGFPVLHKECVRRNLPYPYINENGTIEAQDAWWEALQFSAPVK